MSEIARADLDTLRTALARAVPDMLDEVARSLHGDWPEYATFIALARAEVIASATVAMGLIVDVAADLGAGRVPAAPAMETADPVFEQLGRGHARSGLPLAGLLTSYQAGARGAWRHMAGTAVADGAPAPEVALLAEAVFWLVDHLSAASARGYTEEQSARAAQRERARAELSDLLLSDRADLAAVAAAATRAHWPLPGAIAVVMFAGDAPVEDDGRADGWLSFQRGTLRGLLVGAPVGRAELVSAFRGTGAVVGPAVPPGELPGTLELVEVALRLRRDGVLAGDPMFATDHLDAVIVHRDPQLLADLSRDVLAPLDELTPEARQRMESTLGSWLRLLGDQQAMARDLHVHPQTVRYRLGQLRTLFGPDLDDPALRRRLTLALSWRGGG